MPDLLTHVLIVYVMLTVAFWLTDLFERNLIPVAMAGAGIPDFSKLYLLVSADVVESVMGLPFSWLALHRLGPTIAIAGIFAICFRRGIRTRVFGFLLFGVGSHFVLDLGVKRASGAAPPYLYPLSWWHPPAANLYLSSDLWPVFVTAGVAILVWRLDNAIRN